MKIAVASMGTIVAGHFGHCENFTIVEAENAQIVSMTSIPNPGHKPGFLPNYLADMGVEVIISGGMGGGAVEMNGGSIDKNTLGTNSNSAVFNISNFTTGTATVVTINGGTVNGNGHYVAYVNKALSQITVGDDANVTGQVIGFGLGPVDANTL